MELSAGKFIDFTRVLWLDVILNAVLIVNAIGLTMWIIWGFKERRQGVRGAVRKSLEKAGHARGWRPRTRWIMAGTASTAAVGLIVLGFVLKAEDHHGGDLTLRWGIAYTVLWLLAGPLLRPVAAPRPLHAEDWAASSRTPESTGAEGTGEAT